jgi:hypothetical protein
MRLQCQEFSPHNWASIERDSDVFGQVEIGAHTDTGTSYVYATRDDLIRAVEEVCDATVIQHSDLPEVEERDGTLRCDGYGFGTAPREAPWYMDMVRRYLAIYKHYSQAQPPTDDPAVDALTAALESAAQSTDHRETARALVREWKQDSA